MAPASVHHAPKHFDVWMGAQVHPLDVAIFGLVGYAFVGLFGAPPIAVQAGAFFASIVGAMHHLRAETRCAWLNRLFPFADHHVVHHSRLPAENGDYGNITTLFDQIFGSYIGDDVEATLAKAIAEASAAGRFDVVALLAGELQARRLAREGVLTLDAKKRQRGE